ncbi:MAG TPA: FAD-dependent oxidoreductase [Candidatus Udaeobacter sp.]|jgi:NADH dehydrogenase|nr:FAD-dependent oxidoreductase [Candidatus Udaeobacter sp.]
MAGKRLIILGGGFGGLDVARAIGRSRAAREYWDTVLVDKENFFQFNPLLPAVAVGAVETRHIVYPLREMAQHRRIRFFKNKATSIDLARRKVRLHNELVESYDVLVIGVGSVTNYYGVPGAEANTRPFKTVVDAMTLRARVVELFEMAEQAVTPEQRRRLLSFAIVGGGVTGVEVAAEMMDMARDTLMPRYPSLEVSDLSITVIEGGDRIVNTARPSHSAYVLRFLERRGIHVRRNARVVRVEPRRVVLEGGESVEAFTLLWTAGVCPPPVVQDLAVLHERDGRVRVDEYLHPLDQDARPIEDVFVIGDCAASRRADGKLQPALSQTAIAMGSWVGAALVRRAKAATHSGVSVAAHKSSGSATGRAPLEPFQFHDVGYIISLGQHSSVLDLFGIPLSGKLAWLAWAAAYLIKMVGIRKQLEVGIDHLTHLFFEHDSSQILARRAVLSDDELNLSLGAGEAVAAKSSDGVRSTTGDPAAKSLD